MRHQIPIPPPDHRRGALAGFALTLAALALVGTLSPGDPAVAGRGWRVERASAFGPGLYGNRTACGKTLTASLRGVASRTLPCGARLTIRAGGAPIHVRVVDHGPFVPGRSLDLTAATARDLCSCSPWEWGVRNIEVR